VSWYTHILTVRTCLCFSYLLQEMYLPNDKSFNIDYSGSSVYTGRESFAMIANLVWFTMCSQTRYVLIAYWVFSLVVLR